MVRLSRRQPLFYLLLSTFSRSVGELFFLPEKQGAHAEVVRMEIVNAISKVRFASTGPQHVHLARGESFRVDLLCMDAGQKGPPAAGPCAYYVVTGSATLTTGGSASLTTGGSANITAGPKPHELPAGRLAQLDPGEAHTIANAGQNRLICLVIRAAK
jgi:quercetin dioxygenase-like cupin family protein